MQEFLKTYLERNFTNITARYIVFDGKSDLEKRLPRRLSAWLPPKPSFVVLRDQDSGDCRAIKSNLLKICTTAQNPNAKVCIVCRELESWYIGNLDAVARAYSRPSAANQSQRAKFRNPDNLTNAKQELRKLTKHEYQPIDGSRRFGRILTPNENNSSSFNYFNRILSELQS